MHILRGRVNRWKLLAALYVLAAITIGPRVEAALNPPVPIPNVANLPMDLTAHRTHLTTLVQAPRPGGVVQAATRVVRAAPTLTGVSIWDCIAKYESGGNWASTSGIYEGGLQFLHSTWVAAGGRKYAEHAYQATRSQQIDIASHWLARTSWLQWPNTSRRCGLR